MEKTKLKTVRITVTGQPEAWSHVVGGLTMCLVRFTLQDLIMPEPRLETVMLTNCREGCLITLEGDISEEQVAVFEKILRHRLEALSEPFHEPLLERVSPLVVKAIQRKDPTDEGEPEK